VSNILHIFPRSFYFFSFLAYLSCDDRLVLNHHAMSSTTDQPHVNLAHSAHMADTDTSPAPKHAISTRPYFCTALPEASLVYRDLSFAARDFERLTENSQGTLREEFTRFALQVRNMTFNVSVHGAQMTLKHEPDEGLIPFRDRFSQVFDEMFTLAD
jgi:hypothetical protein